MWPWGRSGVECGFEADIGEPAGGSNYSTGKLEFGLQGLILRLIKLVFGGLKCFYFLY